MAIEFSFGDDIEEACNRFLALPSETHLLCPRVSEDDDEDYDDLEEPGDVGTDEKRRRLEDFRSRVALVYQCSLIFGFEETSAASLQEQFKTRTSTFLQTCSHCVRTWHRNRVPFLKRLAEFHDELAVAEMAQRLDRFDAERISAGLQGAREFIDSQSGIVEQRTFIEQERSDLLVALYEALCCITFLKQPENRANFNYVFTAVQQKRVLKLAEVLPTMTRFLFDEDKTRLAFARASWSRMPQVSADDFEWAVKGCLEDAMQKVNMGDASLPQLQLFWEGIALILNALDPKCFVPALDSLSAQPSLYHLMLSNMSVNSESNLAAVLKVFNMTLQKGPKGLWNCFANFQPAGVAEPVFASPAFKRLLAQTREYSISMPEDNYLKGPVAIAWMKPFIDSIHVNQKSDACDSFLHYLLDDIAKDTSIPAEGRMACFRGAAEALLTTTNAFLDSNSRLNLSGQPAIFTNRIINLVVKHKNVLSLMVKLDRTNITLSRLAISVIGAVLRLDSLVTAAEYFANDNDRPVQREIIKKSPDLWSACSNLLVPGATELAKAVLKALLPLGHVESFRPDKKTKLLPAAKEEFNANLHKVAEHIGGVFDKFEDFSSSDLNQLIDSETMEPVIVALIHGEPAIHRGALAFVKTVTGEMTRSDAILELLKSHFSTSLVSFAKALSPSKDTKPWSPQQQILRYLKDVLDSLCDPRDGLLRSMNLNSAEKAALKQWWSMSWTAIDNAFEGLDYWSKSVDMETMKEFCRQTMELAESFLAQDGLMCSALGTQSISEGMLNPSENSKADMQDILEPPKEKCMGMTTMLRLKDKYLVQVTVNVLGKLLRRLIEFDVIVPPAVIKYVQRTCVKTAQGRYEVPTNLNDQQRAELLRAVGEDEHEDDVQILDLKKFEAPKKQSRLDLDAWSKSGDALSKPMKTTQDHVRGMTPTLEKNRSTLDQFRAASRQSAKPTLKPVASKPAPQRLDAAQLARLKDARLKAQEEKKKRDAEAIAKAKALRAPKSLVSGEGSGLQGLTGVLGKDHTPKGDMMVNSDDEDDDEFDSDDDAAFRAQTQAGKKRAEDASLQRVMQLKAQVGPVKKMKIQRSAKDMRARLIPSMTILHKEILEWDIFHEGNDPPNGVKCSRVSSSYGDPRQYKETFLPLLIYEAWRSFVTDKNETTSKPFGIRVASRMSVDNFFEVTTTMPLKTDSKDEFLSEGDIVLISVSAQPLEGRDDPHCLGRVSRAQIRHGAREISYRISSRPNPIINLLAPKAELYAVKITNMRTIEREFASLESLQYYDLMQEVLEAKPSPMLTFSPEAIDKVKTNYHLNHGQAKAVLHAKENDAFTLVQGPPGTGKTKTITAMVGALMTGSLNTNTGTVIQKPGQANSAQGTSKKLLVCAPSNAAVDELVLRLKQGIKTMSGSFHKINVLRLGRSDAINAAVKDVTLDELVRQRVEGDASKDSGPSSRQQMHEEAGRIKQEISEVRPMLEAARAANDREQTNTLSRRLDDLKQRQSQIGKKIDADKDKNSSAQRDSEIRRRQIQQEILDSAHVLCSTLSGAGHEMLKNLNVEFETVIIDEAAQCVELSALIPLKYGCSKCILVGDPKQLPPTVLSQSAQRFGYDQSLFVRMQQNSPKDIHLLDQQYRMHPEISMFPSAEFYEGKLADGDDMARLRHQPWHQTGLLGPYRFFDVLGSQERGRKGQSLVNYEELKVAMQLYERFKLDNPRVELKGKIGIITPYKAQLYELRDRFASRYGPGISEEIEFNTTDAFQGRECEIIIFSCVRASPTGGIGFMTDIRRMNVGLTRAKSSLWILGDSRALVQGEFWNKLIENAKARDRYTSGDILRLLSRPGAKLPPPTFNAPSALQAPAPSNKTDAMEVDDVDMKDIPIRRPSSSHNQANHLPETHTLYQPPVPVHNLSAYTGIDERGEPATRTAATSIPPVIHASTGQKRSREGSPDIKQPTKKPASGFLPGKSRPRPPMPRPTDPSAMSVLGASAGASSPGGSKPPAPPNAPKAPRPKPNPMIAPKKKAPNPLLGRKPNPR